MPPSVTYTSPGNTTHTFTPLPSGTNGTTTGPSSFVLSKGAVDRDAPSEARDTPLGLLRCQLTSLQDQVNEFLTARMEQEGKTQGKTQDKKESEAEKQLLDGGD